MATNLLMVPRRRELLKARVSRPEFRRRRSLIRGRRVAGMLVDKEDLPESTLHLSRGEFHQGGTSEMRGQLRTQEKDREVRSSTLGSPGTKRMST